MFLSKSWASLICLVFCLVLCAHATTWEDQSGPVGPVVGHLVKRGDRKLLISTEFGQVSGAKVSDGNETFLLHLISLEPNSLFLPVMLRQDMVSYVHTGSGTLSYQAGKKNKNVGLRRGDVFRLESGTVFFLQSDLDTEAGSERLRIHAIFGDAEQDLRDPAPYSPYSSIRDLILGFDNRTLQETFKVPAEVIEEIRRAPKPGPITRGIPTTKKTKTNGEYEIDTILISRGAYSIFETSNKSKSKRKSNSCNIFGGKRDFQNCYGWSTTVTEDKCSDFEDSKYGLFMVNLTRGGMMGPHWNPRASEIAVVLEGKGIVRVVCPSLVIGTKCKNARFAVEEGDSFVVPKFHPMAQLAFNNATFVFVGFSTSVKYNHPQYLAGKASVYRTLDSHIMAMSLGVNDTTYDKLMNQQGLSVILECVSCAEEEYRIIQEEIQREREAARQREEEGARKREEEKKRQEEEVKKREEEEERQKQQQEAEQKEKEQEEREARQREEEKRKQGEEKRKKEQEAAERRKREEEGAKQQQEAEQKKREQEEREARQREEEKRRQAEEAARQREEEERRKREREAREAAAAREAEREREAQAKREEEAAKQQEAGQGGGGKSQEGTGEQPPEQGRKETEARRQEEAARHQEEEPRTEEEQGGGTGWEEES